MRPMKVRGKGRIACVFWALGTALVQGGCQRGADAKPLKLTFSQESGCYENPFELELSTEKGDIYYTLDGSDPRDSDTRIAYKGAISVTDRSGDANVLSAIDPAQYDAVNVEWDSEKQDFVSTIGNPKDDEVDKMTVVRAVAQSSGRSSDVVTQSYFVGDMTEHVQGIEQSCDASGQDLAIMSITVNSSDMFDSKTGIYVKGDIYQKALEDLIRDAEDSCPVCRLTEPQTVRLEHLYDVLYNELTEGNDDGAHHLLLAILTLVQQFRATAAEGSTHSGNAFAQRNKE